MSLYDIGLWISQLQLWFDRLNVLGLIWLLALSYYTFRQIRGPLNAFRIQHNWKPLASWRLLLLSVVPVALSHFVSDEVFTAMMFAEGHVSVQWILDAKPGVYLAIAFCIVMALLFDLQTRYKWSWLLPVLAVPLLSIQAYAAINNVGDYSAFQGWERFWRFWVFYPSTKGLLGLCYASVLRRKGQ